MSEPASGETTGKGPLVFGIILVALGVALLTVIYWPTSAVETTTDARASSARTSEAAQPRTPRVVRPRPQPLSAPAIPPPESETEAEAPSRPEFWEDPGPELLETTYDFLTHDDRKLRSTFTMQLYEYGKENPSDPRPQLLLAFDDMKRGWWKNAVTHYRMAYEADPRSKQEPRMLRHLAYAAGQPKEREAAVELIRRVYGERALEGVEAEIASLKARGGREAHWWLEGLEPGLEALR